MKQQLESILRSDRSLYLKKKNNNNIKVRRPSCPAFWTAQDEVWQANGGREGRKRGLQEEAFQAEGPACPRAWLCGKECQG